MARKDNNPDKMDTEKETGTKRRYQSPQTPPQAPRSRTQGREQGRGQDGQSEEYVQIEGQEQGEGRGTSQEYGQSQDMGRGMSQQSGQEQETQQGRQGQREGWQEDGESGRTFGAGSFANRGADFDLQKASRDELNAIAQELNIDEYDTMTREELVIEIRERS